MSFSKLKQQGWGKRATWECRGSMGNGGPGKGAARGVLKIQWQTTTQPQESFRLEVDDVILFRKTGR